MDSATDVPIILTEKFADQCAEAIVKVIVKRAGLKKKVVEQPKPAATEKEYIYRVQVGAYSNPSGADNMLVKLEAAGFSGFVVKEEK